jgi:hypothetical protein
MKAAELMDESLAREVGFKEDWAVIEKILPSGWERQAKRLRALIHPEKMKNAATLLRVLLMHLADGTSLRETAARAKAAQLMAVSDVALLKQLRKCGAWFGWMTRELMAQLGHADLTVLPGKRIRLIDGTAVCEPGATGTSWRVHYSLNLGNLCCDEVHVTGPETGESLTQFEVRAGDVLLGDRGLAHRRGIRHVVAGGGDVIVRLNLTNVPLEDEAGQKINILARVRSLQLQEEASGEWLAWIRDEQGRIPVRVCVRKHDVETTRQAQDKLRKEAKKKGRKVREETLEAAGYVMVLTTLQSLEREGVLELYRCRWQVELEFKRLKSLLQLGHLKKTDGEGAKAWLQGKLLVACLIETLIAMGERFSPPETDRSDGTSSVAALALA